MAEMEYRFYVFPDVQTGMQNFPEVLALHDSEAVFSVDIASCRYHARVLRAGTLLDHFNLGALVSRIRENGISRMPCTVNYPDGRHDFPITSALSKTPVWTGKNALFFQYAGYRLIETGQRDRRELARKKPDRRPDGTVQP